MERLVVPFTSDLTAGVLPDLVARGLEVVAVAVDIGQGIAPAALRDVALAAGATRCHVFERRDRLAAAYLWPALRIGAVAAPGEPIVTALSAPCVAETAVEVARIEGATSIAAAAPSPRARQRLLAAVRGLAPDLGVVAVAGAGTAEERHAWALVRQLAEGDAGPVATERGGESTVPARVTVTFEHGVPVALNQVAAAPDGIVDSLSTLAGAHGVPARVVHGGDQAPGRQWLVHAPGAEALQLAAATLVAREVDEATRDFLAGAAASYAGLVRDGHWFTRLRRGCDALAAEVLEAVSGEVTMTMQHGRIEVMA